MLLGGQNRMLGKRPMVAELRALPADFAVGQHELGDADVELGHEEEDPREPQASAPCKLLPVPHLTFLRQNNPPQVSEGDRVADLVRRRCDHEALRGQLLADVSQLLHRAKFNLSNALTSDVQRAADFL